ncbi:LysR substrate-binding domain-containing protein [Ancylobacter sp. 6x-1]|uniref:LysR substrate-binding domain-containing protein n=1 Tax=Ancylobacter crimeensis TaxID=2579147 RepID=A0ABT0DDH5_9HYPH|nr:LysR substrate-binding domain-containing protein [Ancylobacter crimeensis]MCK0197934.1 LysR substrate-binding domain-containing protein [Ancylobacter crimeensis]
MTPHLDLDLLRSFVTVVEAGTLSAAAPRIGRSQSAVSMQIQRLEQSLGAPLLLRLPRSVELTPAGADFLVYARRLLKLSEEAVASISRPVETGLVRLGVPDDYAAMLLPQALARFAEAHPRVALEVVCEPSTHLLPAIGEGRLDLAIVTGTRPHRIEVLRREPLVWVASPHHVPWMEDPLPVALFEPGCSARMNVIDALGAAGRAYRGVCSSASLLGVTAVVEAGLAVAGLAACSVPPQLKVIGEAEGLPPLALLEMCLLRHPGAETPAVLRLEEVLRRELASLR